MLVVLTKRKFSPGMSVRRAWVILSSAILVVNQSGGPNKNEVCSLVSVGEKEEEEERVRVTVAPPPHHTTGPMGARLASEPTTFKQNGTQSFKFPPKKSVIVDLRLDIAAFSLLRENGLQITVISLKTILIQRRAVANCLCPTSKLF